MTSASRPFRFGVQAYDAASADEWTDLARTAEALGYSCFSVADHYFGPGAAATAASHPVQSLAAIPAMAVAAAVTSSIMIGSRVMCVDYHQPVVLAKSLATIDVLSNGRLEAGLGAGWITSEYAAMGITMDRPGVRIERLAEVIGLSRAFFAGADLDIDGEYVQVHDMAAVPAAVQPGGPKLMVGGGAPRVLRTAGELADIVSINFDNAAGKLGGRGLASGTAEGTAAKLEWVRKGAGARYDDIEIEIGAYFTAVSDHGAAVREKMAAGFGMTGEQLATYPHALVGSVGEICETLHERRERYDISYVTVGAAAMHDFAPVVATLTGT
ncbi:MAG: TIGR03621 family F420-dependent LLM class oxidoreductase [Actinomycetota bacterium]